ncbi:MAG: hypothetical protein EBU61_03245, partial [Crocinitomicaceae bacterium]|nr:hypothetical protein [Crocinitomicaceae bacterium]
FFKGMVSPQEVLRTTDGSTVCRLILGQNANYKAVFFNVNRSRSKPDNTDVVQEAELVKVDQQWKIRFVGNVSDVVDTEIQKLDLEKWVEFIPYVEHKKAVEYMINTDLLLLIIPNTENNKGILTGKLFEYIATGNPIIFIGPENGDAVEILKKTEGISYLNFNSEENIIPFCSSVLKKSEKSKQINYIYSRRNLAETFAKLCLK